MEGNLLCTLEIISVSLQNGVITEVQDFFSSLNI